MDGLILFQLETIIRLEVFLQILENNRNRNMMLQIYLFQMQSMRMFLRC